MNRSKEYWFGQQPVNSKAVAFVNASFDPIVLPSIVVAELFASALLLTLEVSTRHLPFSLLSTTLPPVDTPLLLPYNSFLENSSIIQAIPTRQ